MKENNSPLRMLYQAEITFENESQKKIFSGTQTERIHCQHTDIKRNNTWDFFNLNKNEGSTEMQKGLKSTGQGKILAIFKSY